MKSRIEILTAAFQALSPEKLARLKTHTGPILCGEFAFMFVCDGIP